jgi:hypothetical protein
MYDDELVKLISSFCNLPIFDKNGRVYSPKTGVPPVEFIFEILFNIIFDDVDRSIEARLPSLQFVRLQHEIIIPIFHKEIDHLLYYLTVIHSIVDECHLNSPSVRFAHRDSEPINFSGGLILINTEGQCQIQGQR